MKTYTINGKEYSEFDINNRCAELLAWKSELNVKKVEFEDGCFWVHSIGYTCFPVQNYSSDPQDAWPIIEKCWDELMRMVNDCGESDWPDSCDGNKWKYIIATYNCTKLVAACICFIEVNS